MQGLKMSTGLGDTQIENEPGSSHPGCSLRVGGGAQVELCSRAARSVSQVGAKSRHNEIRLAGGNSGKTGLPKSS